MNNKKNDERNLSGCNSRGICCHFVEMDKYHFMFTFRPKMIHNAVVIYAKNCRLQTAFKGSSEARKKKSVDLLPNHIVMPCNPGADWQFQGARAI